MAEECECEVRCDKCGSWFPYPKAPIHFASWEEYYESDKRKVTVRCPKCGAETELKKENTRFPGKKTGKDSARGGK